MEILCRGPRRAGELAEALDASPAGLSRHLRVLRESGVVAEEPLADDARVRVYQLQRQAFEDLRAWTEEVESFWTLQLGSFKDHAERTRGRGVHKRGSRR